HTAPTNISPLSLHDALPISEDAEASGKGRSAVELSEFQEDAVKKARRLLSRYDGVLVADSVGLGKTWIGKKLLEDYAYHQRYRRSEEHTSELQSLRHLVCRL